VTVVRPWVPLCPYLTWLLISLVLQAAQQNSRWSDTVLSRKDKAFYKRSFSLYSLCCTKEPDCVHQSKQTVKRAIEKISYMKGRDWLRAGGSRL
jgi:hypothetical protein